jgi:hypothetical protein
LISKGLPTALHNEIRPGNHPIRRSTHNDIFKENTSKLDAGPQVKIDLNLNIYKGAYL